MTNTAVFSPEYSDKVDDPTTACLNIDMIQAGHAREYFGVGDKTWAEFKNK